MAIPPAPPPPPTSKPPAPPPPTTKNWNCVDSVSVQVRLLGPAVVNT